MAALFWQIKPERCLNEGENGRWEQKKVSIKIQHCLYIVEGF